MAFISQRFLPLGFFLSFTPLYENAVVLLHHRGGNKIINSEPSFTSLRTAMRFNDVIA